MKIKNIGFWAIVALAASVLATPAAHSQTERFTASLTGLQEVPPINTDGKGTFEVTNQAGVITFSLTFGGLSSTLTAAHIHFGQIHVSGGVMIFVCGGGGQPDCPAVTDGTITGTITAANVTGPTTQGVDVGDLASALDIMRDGVSYVNLHTTNFPAGEIRGQLRHRPGP